MLRATFHSLFAHKLRLVLTALSVVLGVAFVAGTFMFTDTLDRSIDRLFDSVVADVSVTKRSELSSDAATTVVPESLIETVQGVDGVEDTYGTIFVEGGVSLVDENNEVLATGGAPTFGTNWDSGRRAYGEIQLVDGDPPSSSTDVVMDKASADRFDLDVGDQVDVITVNGRVQATITGVFTYGESEGLGSTAVGFETETAQQLLLEPGEFTSVDAVAAAGVDTDQLADRVQAAVGSAYEVLSERESADEFREDVDQVVSIFRTILLVFAAIALFVGVFIIINTFSILVAQRTRELALFRAVGASRRQVTRSVLTEAVVVGLLSAAIGLLLGFALATGLRALLAAFGADFGDEPLVLEPRTVVVAFAVGILVTVVAAYLPARRAARIPPVAALREDVTIPPTTLRRRLIVGGVLTAAGMSALAVGLGGAGDSTLPLVGLGVLFTLVGIIVLLPVIARPVIHVLGRPFTRTHGAVGVLARENAMRNPRRTAVTSASLMIGLALVAAVSVVASSLKSSTDKLFEETLGSDYLVMTSTGQPFSTEIGDELAAVSGVQQVTRTVNAPAVVGEREVFVAGVTPAGFGTAIRANMIEGSLDALARNELLVSEDTAEQDNLRVGETVHITLADGERSLRIGGIYENNPLLGGHVMHYDLVQDLSGRTQDNILLLSTGGDTGERLRGQLEGVLAPYPNVAIEDQEESKESNRAAVDQLLFLIYALLLLAIIIAVIGIINTLVLSVHERTREIGLLRAVGLARRQLRRMIRIESIVICVFGALAGVIVGAALGLSLVQALREEGMTETSIPWLTPWFQSLAFFVLVAALIGVIAAVWPARRATKLDVIAAITTE